MSLSTEETEVLKGLTFCPSIDADKFQIVKDVHLFVRRLMYQDIYDNPHEVKLPLSDTCEFNLDKLEAIDNFMDLWEEGHTGDNASLSALLCGAVIPSVSFPHRLPLNPSHGPFQCLAIIPIFGHLSSRLLMKSTRWIMAIDMSIIYLRDIQALKSLQKNSSLVVKPAYKGGNVVIMDVENYISPTKRNGTVPSPKM